MALVSKSLDEITTGMIDDYDAMLEETTQRPLRVWRNNNNKLYLIFRGIANGFKLVLDTVLALKNRFDPLYCDVSDLYSTCKLVGTEFKEGKGSIVQITITNKSAQETKELLAGIYDYRSVSGVIFSFQMPTKYIFQPEEEKIISAISEVKGSYRVEANKSIKLVSREGNSIDPSLQFSCEDNINRLGYPDESDMDARERILYDVNRQDHLQELELKIRNLPNIFECNLILNASEASAFYDEVPFGPRELLVVLTGAPSNDVARLIADEVLYATCQVDPAQVVYYENDLYIDGKYPVYYMEHGKTNFSMEITYQYDKTKIKPVQIEADIDKLFEDYTKAVQHIDNFSIAMVHSVLQDVKLPSVTILEAVIYDTDAVKTSFLRIPKTRLPHLTGINYLPQEVGT